MSEQGKPVTNKQVRNLVPLNELTDENLTDLLSKTKVEALAKGRPLFKKGDDDKKSYYLLSGSVLLTKGDGNDKTINAGTQAARFPLDHTRPRQSTAITSSEVTYFTIDNDHLDLLLTWDQNAGYMVTDLDEAEEEGDEDEGDWMSHMLRSNIFHKIPATNIQAVFMKMENYNAKAGDVIIKQGDEGDYYYYMKTGRAAVTLHSAKTKKNIKLAELEAGTGFGEEALVSDSKRNATVTMMTDGSMMRLGKDDFKQLLKEPVLENITFESAKPLVENGEAVFLDVRLESEHKNKSIPGSINIPLYLLRVKCNDLDKSKKYIVYCDTARRSSSAAFVLNEKGFDAVVLRGGLNGLQA